MVFTAGRGRPPKATKESGAVSFDADAGCFVGANGMYWHGTANGGWSRQPPSGDKETGEKSSAKRASVDEPEAAAKKKPRGRPPACGHVEHRRSLSARSCSGCPELRPASAKAAAARNRAGQPHRPCFPHRRAIRSWAHCPTTMSWACGRPTGATSGQAQSSLAAKAGPGRRQTQSRWTWQGR